MANPLTRIKRKDSPHPIPRGRTRSVVMHAQGTGHRAEMVLAAGGKETGHLENRGRAIGYSIVLKT